MSAKENSKMFFQTMLSMASAAFGLVVALAWNEAIKAAMEKYFKTEGEEGSLTPYFTYAVIATIVAVIFVMILARIASKVGGEAAITREADL